ncbi:hypothetical protein RRG08_015893 [Elysia crispata]|uniref:Uncharacterized protein n=1 Tax=Elysia crispata TaxID=231223 RepID=A0AAE1E2H7_9GAST|nr:hypothetical protein RRG08_015893 [Elysia crispata]
MTLTSQGKSLLLSNEHPNYGTSAEPEGGADYCAGGFGASDDDGFKVVLVDNEDPGMWAADDKDPLGEMKETKVL